MKEQSIKVKNSCLRALSFTLVLIVFYSCNRVKFKVEEVEIELISLESEDEIEFRVAEYNPQSSYNAIRLQLQKPSLFDEELFSRNGFSDTLVEMRFYLGYKEGEQKLGDYDSVEVNSSIWSTEANFMGDHIIYSVNEEGKEIPIPEDCVNSSIEKFIDVFNDPQGSCTNLRLLEDHYFYLAENPYDKIHMWSRVSAILVFTDREVWFSSEQ